MGWGNRVESIEEFKGLIFKSIYQDKYELIFETEDGKKYRMFHEHELDEYVYIEDIDGELDFLIGSEILMAEEASNSTDEALDEHDNSWTWTYYKLATLKGYVTIRWYGSSDGHYSESVEIEEVPMSKYIIGEILDNDTQERSEEFGYRVGSSCIIDDSQVEIGTSLIITYPERDALFKTSPIVDFEQTDYGVWITTENTTYRLDNRREI